MTKKINSSLSFFDEDENKPKRKRIVKGDVEDSSNDFGKKEKSKFEPRKGNPAGTSRPVGEKSFSQRQKEVEFKPKLRNSSAEEKPFKKTESYGKPYKKDYSGKEEKGTFKKKFPARASDSGADKPRFPKRNFDSDKQSSFKKSFTDKDSPKPNRAATSFSRGKESYSEGDEVKRYQGIVRRKEYIKSSKTSKGNSEKASEEKAKNDDGLMRLNKVISNAGICSRREADTLISSGAVTVNSKVVTELGYKIAPSDIVHYGGQLLSKEKMVYILLNKPKDYITTVDDPQKRRTIMDLLRGACKERVYPVGRLDRNTTGLLLLTNDGELTKRLTHPRYEKVKIYHVELDKPLAKKDLVTISQGIELEDGFVKVDEISYVGGDTTKKEVGVSIHSGKNRIVRRIFEHLEYRVVKLDRVVFAGLTKKDLARGRWRFLTNAEISMLYGMDK